MPDVVGSASYEITPDLSGFADALIEALGPALDAAVSTVSSASSDMGNAITANITPAIDDAAASVTGGAEEIAAGITGSIGPAVDQAASDVAAGTTEMSDALESIGAAGEDGAAAVTDAMDGIGPAAAAAGEEAESEVGGHVLSLRDIIEGAAIGNVLADGIEAGVGLALGALGELIDFLPQLGDEFQTTFNQVSIATGATGPALDTLKGDFNDVFGSVPADAGAVGTALSKVTTSLGETGDQAVESSKQMLEFAHVSGMDAADAVQKLSGLFKLFHVDVDQQGDVMNNLLRISQSTGVSLSDLTNSVSQYGAKFQAAGFSIDEVAAMTAKLGQAGVPVGPVMMGINKEVANLEKSGKDAHAGLEAAFSAIANAPNDIEAGKVAVTDFGTRAGPLLAEQIRQGNFSFQNLISTVNAGGDTIDGAAERTLTWHDRLGMLVDTLDKKLEPIATFVFNEIGVAVTAISPVVSALGDVVMSYLAPAFQQLVIFAQPAWDLLDRIRVAFGEAADAIQEGGDAFDFIRTFFADLTGDDQIGSNIAEGVGTIVDAFTSAWAQLQPIRDFLANLFTTVKDAIADFLASNPTISFGLLAGVLGGVVLAAVVGLTTAFGFLAAAVWSALAPVLAVAAPFIGIGAAIGVLVGGVIAAYQHLDIFRNAVDAVVSFISTTAIAVFEGLQQLWNDLWPSLASGAQTVADVWNSSIAPALSGLLTALQPLVQWVIDHWQILAAVLLAPLAPIKLLIDNWSTVEAVIVDVVNALQPFINIFIQLAGGVIADVINEITGFIDIVSGIFSWDWDKVKQGISEVATAVLSIFANIGQAVVSVLDQLGPLILAGLQKLGPAFVTLLTNIPQWLGDLGAILVDVFENAMSFIGADVFSNVPGWVGTLLTNIPQWLGDLGAILLDWIENGFTALGAAITTVLPVLGSAFVTLLTNIPQWLGDLGAILIDWIENAGQFLVSNAGTALAAVGSFIASIPQRFLDGLSVSLSFFLTFLVNAFNWVVQNAPTILQAINDWFSSLPGTIIGWLAAFGGKLVEWTTAALGWVVQNGPTILIAISDWIKSIPGKFIDLVGDMGSRLVDWLRGAFDWLVQNAPGIIQGVLDFFGGLPGKIFDAIKNGISSAGGAVGDLAKSLYNAIAGFVNEHLLDPIRNFKVSIVGQDFTPFQGIPQMPQLAAGGIVTGPTVAEIGEGGEPEAVIPLSELSKMIPAPGPYYTSTAGGATVIVNVTVQATPDTTDEHAKMVGDAAGSAAGEAAQRKLAVNASVYAS